VIPRSDFVGENGVDIHPGEPKVANCGEWGVSFTYSGVF
jgi:hypothetical protein